MNEREALEGVVAAWESTPAGMTSPDEIQRWLIEDMKPAIDAARAVLAGSKGSAEPTAEEVLLKWMANEESSPLGEWPG